VLKLVVTTIAIAYVLCTVDLKGVWRQSTAAWNAWLVAGVVLTMFMQIGGGAVRCHLIRSRLDPLAALPHSLRRFYVAVFCNTVLWGALSGDLVRGWLVSYRGRWDAAVHSVILDRIAALGALAVLVIAIVLLFVARIGGGAVAGAPVGVAAAGLIGIIAVAQLARIPANWRRFRIVRALQDMGQAARCVFLPIMAIAVASEASFGLAAYLLAGNLDTGLSFIDYLLVMQPAILVTSLPVSLGGWGAREAAMVALLGFLDVPVGAALALLVQIGLAGTLAALPGSVIWLSMRSASGAPFTVADQRVEVPLAGQRTEVPLE
jgi:uncharacterized membrane protein YbhN (UPF0104 family)